MSRRDKSLQVKGSRNGKKRILVVDDEPDLVKILSLRLKAAGYEVLEAFEGIQGVKVAQKDRPDLVILDMMMPCMSGLEVGEILKKSVQTSSVPIIYLTAGRNREDEQSARELGVKYFLEKPCDSKILLESIKHALDTAS